MDVRLVRPGTVGTVGTDSTVGTVGTVGTDSTVSTGNTVSTHRPEELPALLAREDGFVWADIATCDGHAANVLRDAFGFRSLADHTQVNHLVAVLLLTAVMSATLLGWAKRQGWW
ncbi:hypothetical protein ACQP2P_18430 [Dactylosporangium sp. CA-139114]|uniref:hypothetical protein n=1 Tax=Dactylosporangium sp. CA-139114 TaxID=3239931 RepID=UPI003D97DECA